MTVQFNVNVVDREVLLRLEQFPEKVQVILEEKMKVLIEALRRKVTENLSGRVLNIKTGALLASLTSGVTRQGSMLIGYVDIEPENESVKEYAFAHEYGGKSYYWIHVGAKGVLANRETGFFSKSDVFHPPMKERSYMRSALAEMEPEIAPSLAEAVEESFR